MALIALDKVVASSVLPTNGFSGGLLDEFPVFGVCSVGGATPTVLWNNGTVTATLAVATVLRKVSAQSGLSALYGKSVQAGTNKSVLFRGVVVAIFGLEMDNTGGTGTQTDVVLIRNQTGAYLLWALSDVTEVPA